jgi:hypothetical protein
MKAMTQDRYGSSNVLRLDEVAVRLSQAGFDGDLDSRVPSLGRGSLQVYGPSEEVSGRAA